MKFQVFTGLFLLFLAVGFPSLSSAQRLSIQPTNVGSSQVDLNLGYATARGKSRTNPAKLQIRYTLLGTRKPKSQFLRVPLPKAKQIVTLAGFSLQATLAELIPNARYAIQAQLSFRGRRKFLLSKRIQVRLAKLEGATPSPSPSPTPSLEQSPTASPSPAPTLTPSPAPAPKASFPIEVFWPVGNSKVVRLATPLTAAYMTFQSYNLSIENLGSVRVRPVAGAWSERIFFNNSNITLLSHGNHKKQSLGIGSTFQTLRFILPQLPVYPGQEIEVEFRFEKENLITTSFKFIDLNFMDLDGKLLLQHAVEAPDYAALPKDTQTLADGKALWLSKSLRTVRDGPSMRAKCTSCHFDDGSDLKFFGFSPETIVNRAFFHGMSVDEGKKVAAYIAALPIERHAHPWDPPFQPGPGLSARKGNGWMAGAGIDAVLKNSDDTLRYVTGDVPEKEDFDYREELEQRDIPIAFELPDWNSWLPGVHPDDLLQDQPYATNVEEFFRTFKTKLATGADSYFTSGIQSIPSSYILAYLNSIVIPQSNILGKGSKSTPETRRALYEISKLPVVKILSAVSKYPQILEQKVWPSPRFAFNLFMMIAPFEFIGAQKMDFRGFETAQHTATLNATWWHLSLLGLRENSVDLNNFSFRWSYVATAFGTISDQLEAPATLVFYFKKMAERAKHYKMLFMLREPLETPFTHLAASMYDRHPGLVDAMLRGLIHTHYDLGGATNLYTQSALYASVSPPLLLNAADPSQTVEMSPNDQWLIDNYERLAHRIRGGTQGPIKSVGAQARLEVISMLSEAWPHQDWALIAKP